MGMEYSSGFCKNCNADRKLERKTPNHILHFLITIVLGLFTMGIGAVIWIVIWILLSVQIGGWRCSTCGSKSVNKSSMPSTMTILMMVLIVLLMIVQPWKNAGIDDTDDYTEEQTEVIEESMDISVEDNTEDLEQVNSLRQEFKEYLQSDNEPSILDANWNGSVLSVGMKNDGTKRDGFAQYVYLEMTSGRYNGIFGNKKKIYITIKNIQTYKNIGEHFCKNNQY